MQPGAGKHPWGEMGAKGLTLLLLPLSFPKQHQHLSVDIDKGMLAERTLHGGDPRVAGSFQPSLLWYCLWA